MARPSAVADSDLESLCREYQALSDEGKTLREIALVVRKYWTRGKLETGHDLLVFMRALRRSQRCPESFRVWWERRKEPGKARAAAKAKTPPPPKPAPAKRARSGDEYREAIALAVALYRSEIVAPEWALERLAQFCDAP